MFSVKRETSIVKRENGLQSINSFMFLAKRNRRPRTDRATSSEKDRRCWYDELKSYPELSFILSQNVLFIYRLVFVPDTPANRDALEYSVAFNDVKGVKGLPDNFPYTWDDVDIPILELLLLKTDGLEYAVIKATSADYRSTEIVKIITGVSLNKDDFEGRMLIYPI